MLTILGANGKLGRATIAQLRQAGRPVRAVLRRVEQAATFQTLGCEVVLADINDPIRLAQALAGSEAVQVICPVAGQATDAAGLMRGQIDRLAAALRQAQPEHVLAISDYGAEHPVGTGVTLVFHHLEMALGQLPGRLTLLRSAEHMQNWSRLIGVAARDGVLPSLHQPLDKAFPTVAAQDVGALSAELLMQPPAEVAPRIIHVEGPRRYSMLDVASILTNLLARPVQAKPLPAADWLTALISAGLSASYAAMVVELFLAHNAGRIDAARDQGPVRRGETELSVVLGHLLPRVLG